MEGWFWGTQAPPIHAVPVPPVLPTPCLTSSGAGGAWPCVPATAATSAPRGTGSWLLSATPWVSAGGDGGTGGLSGVLRAGCCAGEDEEFTLKLINRPMLVLRGEHGFVCYHRGSNLLDSNRSVYDVFHISFSDGAYQIQGGRGDYEVG